MPHVVDTYMARSVAASFNRALPQTDILQGLEASK